MGQERFTHAIVLAGLVVLVSQGGCQDPKEKAAIERAASRQTPGFVRLLNLTNNPVTIAHKGRPLNVSVPPSGYGRLNPVGVGAQFIDIERGDKSDQHEVDLGTGDGHTLVLWPDGQTVAFVAGEPRRPRDGMNLYVAFVGVEGGTLPATYTLTGPNGKVEIKGSSTNYSITPGSYRASDGTTIDIKDPRYAYTLLFVEVKRGTWKPILLLNTDTDVPSGAQSQ